MSLASASRRVVFISLGYICAVVVAVAATVVAEAIPVMLDIAGAWGSIYGPRTDLTFAILVGLMITFPAALPGFIVVLCFIASFGWSNWLFFSIAGALNVFPAIWFLYLFLKLTGSGLEVTLALNLLLFCLPGGFLGGLTFWLVAFRSSDAWPEGARP